MSSEKRLCLRSDSKDRYSFNDCICDDLSEVILQYLPLKDKLRLECVSKQFQKTIFQKQFELNFDKNFVKNVLKNKRIESKSFESVVKNCPNIKSIKLFDPSVVYKNYNQTIHLVIKYCNNLSRIDCKFTQMTEKTFLKFVKKFGSKLKYFYVYTSDDFKHLKSFPNIQDLNIRYPNNLEDFCELRFKCLKKLDINLSESDNTLQTLVERHQSLQYLNINFTEISDKNILNSMLDLISDLNNLIELKIWTKYCINEKLFSISLERIASNCGQLKSFGCNWIIDKNNYLIVSQILSPLRDFKRLKRLELRLRYDRSLNLTNVEMFSFKAFEGFPNITHLTLFVPYISSVNEMFLTDICINLPELQFLNISKRLEASKLTANILSRLSRLEVLQLRITDPSVRDFIKSELSKNCKKFKSLQSL